MRKVFRWHFIIVHISPFFTFYFFVSFFISFLFSYFYLLLLSCHCNFVNNKHSLHISKKENLKVVYLFYVYQMIVTEKLYNMKLWNGVVFTRVSDSVTAAVGKTRYTECLKKGTYPLVNKWLLTSSGEIVTFKVMKFEVTPRIAASDESRIMNISIWRKSYQVWAYSHSS